MIEFTPEDDIQRVTNIVRQFEVPYTNALETLAAAALDWPGEHYLEERYDSTSSKTYTAQIRVVPVGEGAPPPSDWVITKGFSVANPFTNHGLIHLRLDSPVGSAGNLAPSVLSWYRATRRLSERDIKNIVGKYLLRRFENQRESEALVLTEAVGALGIPEPQIFDQLRKLEKIGYVEFQLNWGVWSPGMPIKVATKDDQVAGAKLTNEGHRWAAAGFPDITFGQTTNVSVSVDVHVAVRNVIEQSRQSSTDQETKDRFELLMKRVEDELEKPDGEGDFQPVKDAIEVANNAKGLLGPLIGFLYKNWDQVQRLGGMMF